MRSIRRLAFVGGAVVLAGALGGAAVLWPRPTDPPDAAALARVLSGVYAAFAETEEARIYDRLAEVAAGDMVAELYLQRRSAQIADTAAGGSTEVASVEPYRVEFAALPGGDGWQIDARWRVVGLVRHPNHVHERINLYAGALTLAPMEGHWKLTGFRLEEAVRATDLDFRGGE